MTAFSVNHYRHPIISGNILGHARRERNDEPERERVIGTRELAKLVGSRLPNLAGGVDARERDEREQRRAIVATRAGALTNAKIGSLEARGGAS